MTEDEARALATRFIDTWPNGPRAYIWRDQFADLDHQLAVHAYRTLTREGTRPPTPGQFHDAYRAHQRALTPPDTSAPPDTHKHISLDTYLAGVQAHAEQGDPRSIDEIECWLRYGRTWRQ